MSVTIARVIAALVICIIVAILAALLIKQRSGRVDLKALFGRVELRPGAIKVVETRRLSQYADICLVRSDGRDYLLLLQAGNAQVLNEKPTAASATETALR